MGFLKPKRRTGVEAYGFFAANDAQLSSWLNSQSSQERAEIIATLDALLGAPEKGLFERRLHDLYGQYIAAAAGSEQKARLSAITRILGYEYERVHKGSMSALVGDLITGNGLSDSAEETASPNVFFEAAMVISRAARQFDEIQVQDRKLASSSLFAAAASASILARDVGAEDGTTVRIAQIIEAEDLSEAGKAVFAMSWYFALTFIGSLDHFEEIDPEGWVSAMLFALGPMEELVVVDPSEALELFEGYRQFRQGTNESFPIQLTRWVNLHIGLSDEVDILSAISLPAALQGMRDEFGADLVRQGLSGK